MLRGPHPLSIDDKNLLNRLVMTLLYICTLIPSCVQCICVIAFVLDLKKGQDPDKKKGMSAMLTSVISNVKVWSFTR